MSSYLHNNNFSDETINTTTGDLTSKLINNGWFVSKNYASIDGTGAALEIEEDAWYKAFIDCYEIIGCQDANQNHFDYINFRCSTLVESGIFSFQYSVPANTGNNSKFMRMVFELGIRVGSQQEFLLDELNGLECFVQLKKTNKGIVIAAIKSRN